MKRLPLAALVLSISCSSIIALEITDSASPIAPPITDWLPVYEAAFVCRDSHHDPSLWHGPLDVAQYCEPIDPVAFHRLILLARPGGKPGSLWKGGFTAIGRSRLQGDHYFLIRGFSPDFVRVGVPGSYWLPMEFTSEWNELVHRPLESPGER